jgi:hypothetical protein
MTVAWGPRQDLGNEACRGLFYSICEATCHDPGHCYLRSHWINEKKAISVNEQTQSVTRQYLFSASSSN